MTTAYSKFDEETNQTGMSLPEDDPPRGANFLPRTFLPIRTPNSDKDAMIRCAYVLLMVYGGVSIFFSLIFGIIAFALAYYAWHEHKGGNQRNGLVMGVISFSFATLSYLVPVVLIILLTQRVI